MKKVKREAKLQRKYGKFSITRPIILNDCFELIVLNFK